ncbi:hypothetical protein [Kineosporia babensis]|uniref:Uncharacterized protein n=1 Tax=Kineosporia babensis TaxID=499548 RepID=A0A9X1NMK8_9ACTN|nr:hypothetical protein [Kineosporia babensis]MCD5315891.1 hypothetical protein [Kineosporia babensis]
MAARDQVSGAGLPDPDFIHRLEFAAEGDLDGWDLSDLPPLGTPVVHRHVVEVDTGTEQALQRQAAALGMTIDELILSRIRNNAA